MKKYTFSSIIAIALIFISTNTFAQVKDFNRLSVDISGGLNKIMTPISAGSNFPYFGMFRADIGLRYMANSKFGIKLDFGMDQFKSTLGTVDHKSQMMRGSLQGVVNIGRVCNFEDWTKTISVLGHAGPMIGFLKDVSATNPISGTDRVGGLVLGFSPIFKVGNRLAITTDLSVIGTFTQQRSFDFQTATKAPGFDGYYGTATVGVTVYLGKKSSHIDWKFNDDAALKKRLEELEAELKNTKGDLDLLNQDVKAVEAKLMDDDNDGVANYLDIEPNTPEGATVTTKGQEIKMPVVEDLMNNDPNLGLFYTVQLGVFSNMIPEQYWKDITPLYKMKIEDGTTRFYSGIFHSVTEAKPKLDQAKKNGITDAFITCYYKGKRITVAEADLIISTRGESVLRPKP